MIRGTYNLYVDESGSFAMPGQPSVVCGVLEDAGAGIDWDAARLEVSRAVPFFNHPLHAAVLNTSSAWLAAVMLRTKPSPQATSREHALRRVCDVAARWIAEVPAGKVPGLDAFGAEISKRRIPKVSTLQQVDAWLSQRHYACFRELSALADEYRTQLEDVFRRLFQCYRHGQLVGLAAMAVAASDCDVNAFSGAALHDVRLDPYVRALETLLERVLCLLRGPKATRVDLWVGTRDVAVRGLGSIELSRDALQKISARAQDFPELATRTVTGAAPSQPVLLTPARGVVRFDAGAPFGLVLADFLSNRVFSMMRGEPRCTLAEVQERIATKLSLSLLAAPAAPTATTTLPTLCADGEARGRIRDAYAGMPTSQAGLSPAWNQEQASRWIAFASSPVSSV